MKEVKLSEVISLIENGKTRKEIAQIYELSSVQQRQLFNHPKIKGLHPKRKPLNIIDDINIKEGSLTYRSDMISRDTDDFLPHNDTLLDDYSFDGDLTDELHENDVDF